jgi:hypothetical protein
MLEHLVGEVITKVTTEKDVLFLHVGDDEQIVMICPLIVAGYATLGVETVVLKKYTLQ